MHDRSYGRRHVIIVPYLDNLTCLSSKCNERKICEDRYLMWRSLGGANESKCRSRPATQEDLQTLRTRNGPLRVSNYQISHHRSKLPGIMTGVRLCLHRTQGGPITTAVSTLVRVYHTLIQKCWNSVLGSGKLANQSLEYKPWVSMR